MKERKSRKITLVFPGIFLLFQKNRESGGSGAVCEWHKINVFADGKIFALETYAYEKIHIVRAGRNFFKRRFYALRSAAGKEVFLRFCKSGLRDWPAYKKRRKVFKKKDAVCGVCLKKADSPRSEFFL